MDTDTLTTAGRRGALMSAPLGALSLSLMVFVEASGRSMTSPLAVAAAAAGLAATVALLFAMVWLHAFSRDVMDGAGTGALVVALIGAGLTVGAVWSLVFVAPSVGARYPALLDEPLPAVVAGYVASHLVLGVGLLAWAMIARRAGAITTRAAAVLIIGSVLCILPLPARYLGVAIGVGLVARRSTAQPSAPAQERGRLTTAA